jgi:hypothetical protein
MPVFIPYDLHALHATYAALQGRLDALASAYASFPYRTQAGLQYATHGFLRRFSLMHHCVERVFEIVPPEQEEKPPDAILYDATVFIQSFVINSFGALDNLAWIWASEKPLKLQRREIGLGPKCDVVRASFSKATRDFMTEHDGWFDDLIDFRDALAHRISLYIPPWIVSLKDEDAHKALEARKREVSDIEEFDRLGAEQRKLERFHPLMKHALDDNKPPVPFHFRIVNDFRTVEEIAGKVLVELKRLRGLS